LVKEKWVFVETLLIDHQVILGGLAYSTCSFCQKYVIDFEHYNHPDDCLLCPICLRTGEQHCANVGVGELHFVMHDIKNGVDRFDVALQFCRKTRELIESL
jgi:hypothetical protein